MTPQLHFAPQTINENASKVRAFLDGKTQKVIVQEADTSNSPAYPRSGRGNPDNYHPEHLQDDLAWDEADMPLLPERIANVN